MKRFPIVIAAALAASACGSSEDEGTTIVTSDGSVTVNDGKEGTMTFRSDDAEAVVKTGTGSAENLPDGFTAYPGAKIAMSVDGSQGGKKGGMVAMETSDAPEKVIEFYKRQVADAGLVIHSEGTFSGSHVLGARDENGDAGVNIVANGAGDTTHVQITFGS